MKLITTMPKCFLKHLNCLLTVKSDLKMYDKVCGMKVEWYARTGSRKCKQT